MVDLDMTIATKHQGVVTSELVILDDAFRPNGFQGEDQQRRTGDVLNHLHLDETIKLKDAEYRDFPGESASTIFLAENSYSNNFMVQSQVLHLTKTLL